MKLYYTDSKEQKKLIGESDNYDELIAAADADAARKFIKLSKITMAPTGKIKADDCGDCDGEKVEIVECNPEGKQIKTKTANEVLVSAMFKATTKDNKVIYKLIGESGKETGYSIEG